MFAKTFGCVRFIYNKMLGDRLDYYKETGKKLNNTPAQYKEDFPWLKEVDSLALANAQMNLNKAYNNFFRKHKENYPKGKKGAVTGINKDCVWLYSMRKLLINAATSCIRKLVILQTAMMRLA